MFCLLLKSLFVGLQCNLYLYFYKILLHKMFNHSEGRATCSVQRATCSLTVIDQWGLRHCPIGLVLLSLFDYSLRLAFHFPIFCLIVSFFCFKHYLFCCFSIFYCFVAFMVPIRNWFCP